MVSKDTVLRSSAERGGQNLSKSRSRSVAITVFAITTITYTRTELRDPRWERGASAEAARLSAGGQKSLVIGHRGSQFRAKDIPKFSFPKSSFNSSNDNRAVSSLPSPHRRLQLVICAPEVFAPAVRGFGKLCLRHDAVLCAFHFVFSFVWFV